MSHDPPKYPRTFEYEHDGDKYLVTLLNESDSFPDSRVRDGINLCRWRLHEVEDHIERFPHMEWREILPAAPEAKAFDPATLDWRGIGHIEEETGEWSDGSRFFVRGFDSTDWLCFNPGQTLASDRQGVYCTLHDAENLESGEEWYELIPKARVDVDTKLLRQSLAESHEREKQERALRADAEAEVAKLRERVAVLEAAILDSRQETLFKLTCIESAIEPLRKAVENRRWLGDPNPSDHEAAELRGEVKS